MSGSFKLKNDMLLLSTEAPGGIYNSAQLKKIATLCDGDSAIVKATEDQRLALFVAPDKVDAIAAELREAGLGVRHYQEGLHQPTTCVGSSCAEALQDAMGASIDVTEALSGISLTTPLRIGINGCARCCVPTHTLDVSVIGDTKGYRVSLGGKNSQIPEMAVFMAEGVPASELPGLIRKVVELYRQHVEGDETLLDVMDRVGSTPFIEALAPYSQDAAADADPFGDIGSGGEEVRSDDEASDALDLGDLPDAEAIEGFEAAGDDGAVTDAATELSEADQVAHDDLDLSFKPSKDEDLLLEDEVFEAGDAPDSEELSLGDDSLDLDLEPETIGPQESQNAAPAEAAGAGEDLVLDDLAADEVSDDEADAFEEKIALAVEEEETLGEVQDENAGQRLEAMQLVEANAGLGDQVVHRESDFEDLEIEDDSSLEAAAPQVRPIKAAKGEDAWRFSGIDLDSSGRVVLHFASGVTVALDPDQLEQSRDLNFGGKRVTFTAGPDGIHVEVDGVGLYLPRNAA